MHDTEPVRHGSLLRAGALVLAVTVALLSGLLFSTQTGAYAATDPGLGFKLPATMQGRTTFGGTRLEPDDGTGAWLGTKTEALIELKMKAGVIANDDQASSPATPRGCFGLVNPCTTPTAQTMAYTGNWNYTVTITNAPGDLSGNPPNAPFSFTSTQTAVSTRNLNAVVFYCLAAAGSTFTVQHPIPLPSVGQTIAWTIPAADMCGPIATPVGRGADYVFFTRQDNPGSGLGYYSFGGNTTPGTTAGDPQRSGKPYSRCANLAGDEISVYGLPITYRESEATGIVGSPAPSFTLPTCPDSHPVRMGWGFQGPSGPLATVTAPPIPAALSACANYVCDVVQAPASAAQECHQLNPDGTVSTTPGGPCPPSAEGYCMWGPYSLDAAECAGAPVADPVEVEQDPGCTPDGLANLNPFAWMGGIPCLFKYLFIPDGDAWGDAGASIGAAWDGTAPAVVLDEGNKVFAPVVALQDVTAGDCQGPPFTFPTLAGVTEPFTLHPLSTCNELATYLLGIYLPVATAMTYLGGFFSGTRLLLKSAGAESPVKDA